MSSGEAEAEASEAGEESESETPATTTKKAPSEGGRPLPRWSLTLVAGVHAALFAWAGHMLPWSEWSAFAIVCYVLALGHGLTALTAALALPALVPVWRVSSVLALAVLGWLSWELTSSAAYLAGLYGSLGEGLGTLMLAIIALVALPTLPLSCWGLAATWKRSFNPGLFAATPLLAMVWSLGALHHAEDAHVERLPVPGEIDSFSRHGLETMYGAVEVELFEAIEAQIANWGELPEIPADGPLRKVEGGYRHAQLRVPSLMTDEPVACVPDPQSGESYAVVTYLRMLEDPPAKPEKYAPVEPVTRCIHAPPEAIAEAVASQLRTDAMRGPVKIDLITGVVPLRSRMALLDMLALRPGADGVCDEDHCLMPWQLVALDQFVVNEPLPWIPDFRFGISPVALRRALGFEVPDEVYEWDREQRNPKRLERLVEQGNQTPRPDGVESWQLLEGLSRIETLSFSVTKTGFLSSLVRLHPREQRMTKRRLDHALDIAENHIAKAQLQQGRFRYILHPFSGKQQTSNWNLPRQAGTTLVACELTRDPKRAKRVAKRSLDYMASRGRVSGDLIALIKSDRRHQAMLGSTALPAIAFAACRPHVGDVHDETLAGMTRLLLAMERDDGSFYPEYDTVAGEVIDGPEPMYAGGQAIFALSLAEKFVLEQPEAAAAAGFPSAELLHDAVERAMGFYTGPYWDNFMYDFFWLEENWHCLAARASLEHHRNDAYERYCLDYMAYKSRLLLDEDSGVSSEFVGGYSVGNILVPVNTPAAGIGEGLAAAMAIKQARGESIEREREQMHAIVTFLLRQQWTEEECFACVPNRTVVGGFSESMGAPEIRIDFTQHAWSALGHGGPFIYDELPDEIPGDP